MSVGVAVSTWRRDHFLEQALDAWEKHASGVPVEVVRDYDEPLGVAATKNRGIERLMDLGVEHLFLVDDDVWPKSDGWSEPYVRDREPHLMFCWGRKRLLSRDGHYTVWSWPRGVVLYAERRVVERVGGMRVEFGRYGSEHAEWSKRIHAAGLTTHRYADLAVSPKLWHAEDMGRPGEKNSDLALRRSKHTTLGSKALRDSRDHRAAVMEKYAGSSDFVEYRGLERAE